MNILKLDDLCPDIDESAYVAIGATVIGDVQVGCGSTIWSNAVLRGDNESICVGKNVNVQEGAVLHTDPGHPIVIDDGVSIGHQAMLHGCRVGAGSLIGIQAVVLNGAVIGENCLVAAGALVTEGKSFPDNALIVGVPAKVARTLSDTEISNMKANASDYATKGARYKRSLTPAD